MKYAKLFLFLLAGLFVLSPGVRAQDGPPPEDRPQDDRADARRPNLLAELGLTPEQVQQIRRINQARRPAMIEAQHRMREANRNLDMAIYRDSVSDEEFRAKLQAVQAAQAELARLRFESELAVRKILTAEQLVRFRELRRKFAEARQDNMRMRRMRPNRRGLPPNDGGPLRRPPPND